MEEPQLPFDQLPLEDGLTFLDPFGVYESLYKAQEAWLNAPPEQWQEAVQEFWKDYFELCDSSKDEILKGQTAHDKKLVNDERFRDPLWEELPYFHFLKKQYLLWDKWLQHKIKKTPNLDNKTRRKAAFWTQQFTDMLSPSNFFFSNPVAIKKAFDTQGQSLVEAGKFFLDDLAKRDISMVCKKRFQVGENLAMTPGDVIFKNELMELIYYKPTTPEVHQTPILFIPPWINKYYVLDLKPEKSPVHFLLEKRFSVFMISWKNPTADMRDTPFQDYLMRGILEALRVVNEVCGTPAAHAVGYCIGGTALMMLMAWLNAHPRYQHNNPIAHATTFCSLTDFSHAGEIDVFLDETSISYIEALMSHQGYLDSSQMQVAFRLLRPNSLIWNYFSSQYLLGEPPPAFDVLYWNMDGTRLPAATHSYFLRNMYLNNKLIQPKALEINGIGIELEKITQPLYLLSTEHDHISPWHSVFKITQHYSGPVRAALAGSGHILGVLTPPSDPPKRHYRAGPVIKGISATDWWETAVRHEGSWWSDWALWLKEHCGELIPPPGEQVFSQYPSLFPAPGKYVLDL